MINRNILNNRVMDKINTLSLHAIVNEAFIGALPIAQKNITEEERKKLTMMSLGALESLGGGSVVLEKALENKNLTPSQKNFLIDLATLCTRTATEAADRVTKSTDCDNTDDVNAVVDKAALTDAEYNKFVKQADTITPEEISDVIKQKTIDVIKQESDVYNEEEKVEQDLQDAITDSNSSSSDNNPTPDDNASAKESLNNYMNLILDKKDCRTHVSLFSKLQEAAYENLVTFKKEDYDNIPMKAIESVLYEGSLTDFHKERSMLKCIEELDDVNVTTEITPEDKKDLLQNSFVCAIVIYTLFETLNTMNLYTPVESEISDFINNQIDLAKSIKTNQDKAVKYVNTALGQIKDKIKGTDDVTQLNSVLDLLNKLKMNFINSTCTDKDFLDNKNAILETIDSAINDIQEKVKTIVAGPAPAQEQTQSQMFKRNRDNAEFSKIFTLFKHNSDLNEIQFKVDPADEQISSIMVEGKDNAGRTIKTSYIDVLSKPATKDAIKFATESINNSNLKNIDEPIYLVMNDGRGKKTLIHSAKE